VTEPIDTAASLQRHLEWLYGKGSTYTPGVAPGVLCICKHAWKGGGTLYGIQMGKEWVRTTTEKDCPHHGPVGVAAHEARRKAIEKKENRRGR
jgi:hypothetical protein